MNTTSEPPPAQRPAQELPVRMQVDLDAGVRYLVLAPDADEETRARILAFNARMARIADEINASIAVAARREAAEAVDRQPET